MSDPTEKEQLAQSAELAAESIANMQAQMAKDPATMTTEERLVRLEEVVGTLVQSTEALLYGVVDMAKETEGSFEQLVTVVNRHGMALRDIATVLGQTAEQSNKSRIITPFGR